MNALFTGLMTVFNATVESVHNALYTSVGGRLYLEEMPTTPIYPSIVMHLITDAANFNFSSNFEDIIIQFNIYSNQRSSNEAGGIFEHLKTLFDRSRPAVSGYTTVHMQRDIVRLVKFQDEGLWQYSVRYKILLRK